ncbi:MAG: hypothetical protein ACOY5W_00310 [Pseudomonadota bacterium]|jgi:hypothetical protein
MARILPEVDAGADKLCHGKRTKPVQPRKTRKALTKPFGHEIHETRERYEGKAVSRERVFAALYMSVLSVLSVAGFTSSMIFVGFVDFVAKKGFVRVFRGWRFSRPPRYSR